MRLTPRGLRRTFNDLARADEVESLVTRSISGYLTDRMLQHYFPALLHGHAQGAAREHRAGAPSGGAGA